MCKLPASRVKRLPGDQAITAQSIQSGARGNLGEPTGQVLLRSRRPGAPGFHKRLLRQVFRHLRTLLMASNTSTAAPDRSPMIQLTVVPVSASGMIDRPAALAARKTRSRVMD